MFLQASLWSKQMGNFYESYWNKRCALFKIQKKKKKHFYYAIVTLESKLQRTYNKASHLKQFWPLGLLGREEINLQLMCMVALLVIIFSLPVVVDETYLLNFTSFIFNRSFRRHTSKSTYHASVSSTLFGVQQNKKLHTAAPIL